MSTSWPELSIAEWDDTRATLHQWTQIVGKVRTAGMPWLNHSWHTTLYVTPRGLTTLSIPHQERTFQIDFDFVDHRLRIASSDGGTGGFALEPMAVADFHRETLRALEGLGLAVSIHGSPNEVDPAIPFAENRRDSSYDPAAVDRLRRALVQADRVMTDFRSRFLGKCSPVHFFWGSFDLAVTRFSGRPAPAHPGGFPNMPDWITREAYSQEVSSAGFWLGAGKDEAFFYSYAYPSPAGFAEAAVRPSAAAFSQAFGEFILPYDAVRRSSTPDEDLLAFFQSTYEAAADLAGWDRAGLEWEGPPQVRRP